MENSILAPIDLSDDVSLRRHLQIGVNSQQTRNTLYVSQEIKKKLYSPKHEIKKLDEDIQKVIDEVNYNLKDVDAKTVLLETNLGENYATITEISGVYATKTAVGAIYGLEVKANGHIAGYKSIATGDTSLFQIYAEKFVISSSATDEGYNPFAIDVVNHKINMSSDVAINGNLVVDGSITSDQMSTNVLLVGGQIKSSDFVTIGGPGFRLKATAAGTSTDPTIYGAYIRGATIDSDSDISAATAYTEKFRVTSQTEPGNSGSPIYLNTVHDTVGGMQDGGTYYMPSTIRVLSPSFGSGYDISRLVNYSNSVVSIKSTAAPSMVTFGTSGVLLVYTRIQYSIDNSTWHDLVSNQAGASSFVGLLPAGAHTTNQYVYFRGVTYIQGISGSVSSITLSNILEVTVINGT